MSAILTARLSRSASLCTATVSSPSSRAARMIRTAISPRLAISSRLKRSATRSSRLDDGERLPRLDGAFVLDQEAHDPAGRVGRHFAELLHDFDQPDRVTGFDRVAFLDVGLGVRRGLAVKGPGKRAKDFMTGHGELLFWFVWTYFGSCGRVCIMLGRRAKFSSHALSLEQRVRHS